MKLYRDIGELWKFSVVVFLFASSRLKAML